MNASEVIAKLTALIEAHGDLPVYVPEMSDYGGSYPTDGPEYHAAELSGSGYVFNPERFYMP